MYGTDIYMKPSRCFLSREQKPVRAILEKIVKKTYFCVSLPWPQPYPYPSCKSRFV